MMVAPDREIPGISAAAWATPKAPALAGVRSSTPRVRGPKPLDQQQAEGPDRQRHHGHDRQARVGLDPFGEQQADDDDRDRADDDEPHQRALPARR